MSCNLDPNVSWDDQTVVAAEHYTTYRDPANFRLPDDFIPERWFDSAFDTDQKAAMQAFSTGPRNCLGKKYLHSFRTPPVRHLGEANVNTTNNFT